MFVLIIYGPAQPFEIFYLLCSRQQILLIGYIWNRVGCIYRFIHNAVVIWQYNNFILHVELSKRKNLSLSEDLLLSNK